MLQNTGRRVRKSCSTDRGGRAAAFQEEQARGLTCHGASLPLLHRLLELEAADRLLLHRAALGPVIVVLTIRAGQRGAGTPQVGGAGVDQSRVEDAHAAQVTLWGLVAIQHSITADVFLDRLPGGVDPDAGILQGVMLLLLLFCRGVTVDGADRGRGGSSNGTKAVGAMLETLEATVGRLVHQHL